MLFFHHHAIYGAIFDMDGTMFDTERLRFKTLQQASKELMGQSFSEQYLMACLGLSARSAAALAEQYYGKEVPYDAIRQRADFLERQSVRQQGVPIKKGLVQVLERLRKSGLRMAVATSSRREIAEEYLINANVYKFFDVVATGDEVAQGKPHPEIFLTAAAQLGLDAQQCLMFEDSENGIRSAHAAGGVGILLKDIKAPNADMLACASFYYATLYDYLNDLDQSLKPLAMPQLQQAFPQSLNQLSVGIHGFGAIGGGYLAQILSYWDGYTRPQRIYASTGNSLYREMINAFGSYSIRYAQQAYDERIDNIVVIDADDRAQMNEMYLNSCLIAICLPEAAIADQAAVIAQGLYARDQAGLQDALTLLIILNKVDAKRMVMAAVKQALTEITDAVQAQRIMQQHYFCDTVVNRMVIKLSDQALYRQLHIKYNLLRQQQAALEEEDVEIDESIQLSPQQQQRAQDYIQNIKTDFQSGQVLQSIDLILFHSEADMPIYVENASPLLKKMCQMVLVKEIGDIQLIKNRLWNGVHAMLAWYACYLQHERIGIALGDPRIQQFVQALQPQVIQALRYQLPHWQDDLEDIAQRFLQLCQSAFKDSCERVARDPLRKLAVNERIWGSLLLNVQHQLAYDQILQGMVLGYVYAMQNQGLSRDDVLQHIKQQLAQSDLVPSKQQQLFQAIADTLQQWLVVDAVK